MCCNATAQVLDTGKVIAAIAGDLGSIKKIAYSYNTDIHFPNGDRDHLSGFMYVNARDKVYYNECDAFTVVYSSRWFYQADHRNKTITIIDLDKQSTTERKRREKEIFEGQALASFFNSFSSYRGRIKKYLNDGNKCEVELSFPLQSRVRHMRIVYNPKDTLMISSETTMMQPWQRTPKGVQSVEVTIKYSDFKKEIEKNQYDIGAYFSYDKKMVKVKKYNDYKLSAKI